MSSPHTNALASVWTSFMLYLPLFQIMALFDTSAILPFTSYIEEIRSLWLPFYASLFCAEFSDDSLTHINALASVWKSLNWHLFQLVADASASILLSSRKMQPSATIFCIFIWQLVQLRLHLPFSQIYWGENYPNYFLIKYLKIYI